MSKQNPRILFVDDHEDTRFMITTLLTVRGYLVTAAASVSEGVQLAQTRAFDLYLLDSRFADGTGRELCEQIRAFDAYTPIVFYSGESPTEQELHLACGAQGYVVKPSIDALTHTIEQTL